MTVVQNRVSIFGSVTLLDMTPQDNFSCISTITKYQDEAQGTQPGIAENTRSKHGDTRNNSENAVEPIKSRDRH